MFRLIKLAAYALLGYALYEFFVGLTSEEQNKKRLSGGDRGVSRPQRELPPSYSGGRAQRLAAHTQSPDGGRGTQTVGRGVIGR
jgi:hypothetical protein